MALPAPAPTSLAEIPARYANLLVTPSLIDTRDHLSLFYALPGHILEIGCDCGQSTTAFLAGAAATVTSIDINPHCAANFPDSPRWTFILGNSHLPETFFKVCNQTYDVLYVDGGHSYEDAMSDLRMYSKLVRPGGLVLVHDVLATDNFPGVWRAFNDFRRPFGADFVKYVMPGSYGLGVIEV
jgi:cephalosporin hydroxylase